MISHDGKRLEVLDDFRVDRSLPKFKEAAPDVEIGTLSGPVFVQRGRFRMGNNGPLMTDPWYDRLWARIRGRRRVRPTMTVEVFFSSVKNTAAELEVVKERARGYEDAIGRAHAAGQTALAERLGKNLVACRSEAQLVALGHAKYLEEASVVEFVKKSPRGLRLDWLANFMRQVPAELVARKAACDERGIFDNYAVLHYDPDGKSWEATEAEKREAKRDPILFGLIEGRRRLYYVGDWIDEFCDLTLDQIADSIGKDAVREVGPA